MTYAQIFVTYAVCWWLVLFMVLPHGADAPKNPGLGHAPSAPANPMLKKKIIWTSLIAIIPAVAIYFIAGAAKAEEGMYTTKKGGCEPYQNYHAPADLEARDGYATGGKKVKPANLESQNILGNMDKVNIGLDIPSAGYLDPKDPKQPPDADVNKPKHNVDLSQTYIGLGKLSVGRDGTTTLNDQPIENQAVYPPGCDPKVR